MSAFELYHIQGIHQYRTTEISREKDYKVVIKGVRKTNSLRCPLCGSKNVKTKGWKERVFVGVPMGLLKTEIQLMIPRVHCHHCGCIRQVHLEFLDGDVRYTRNFARFAKLLLRFCTCKAVAEILRVSWDTIKDIDKKDLKCNYGNPSLKDVENIAIDEITVKNGQKYMTVVVDLTTMTPLYVGDGRGKDAIKGFYENVQKSRCKIKSVAIDRSASFTSAVKEYFPKAVLVYDHFHVIKRMNEAITSCRRSIYKEITDPAKKEPSRLENALKMNEPLSKMYYLRRTFISCGNSRTKRPPRVSRRIG